MFKKNNDSIVNRGKWLAIIATWFLSTNCLASDSTPDFTIKFIKKNLSIYLFPPQMGLANTYFSFRLEPFITVVRPEINYLVSNTISHPLNDMELSLLPVGVTRVYEGDNVCPERFTLQANQSCLLRFYVDKNQYEPTNGDDPRVCIGENYCAWPSPGQRLDESVLKLAGPTEVQVTPVAQDGLVFDPATLSIAGTPTRNGIFNFSVSAANGSATAGPRELTIYVDSDPKDKPVFKTNFNVPSAMLDEEYKLNLMDLIEPISGFMISNQVSFYIVKDKAAPDWLSIDKDNPFVLHGHVPLYEAGQIKEVTLIARSNTGGDSAPLTIKIPVAFDPALKPIIEKNIELRGEAGFPFNNNFRPNISDPAKDNRLKIILDKIEPTATWLSVSESSPTELIGIVPQNDVGQIYYITLHANTVIGGDSEPVTIPLKIFIDKTKTPQFYMDNPVLPLLNVGQPYFHDFVASHDIYPEYSDIPYTIELAEGHRNPYWVRIEDNKLIIDRVPDKLKQIQQIFITIKNVPGGKSEVWALDLFVMG